MSEDEVTCPFSGRCRPSCGLYIPELSNCSFPIIAKSLKGLHDICKKQDEECREDEKRGSEIKLRAIRENRPIYEIEKEMLKEKGVL